MIMSGTDGLTNSCQQHSNTPYFGNNLNTNTFFFLGGGGGGGGGWGEIEGEMLIKTKPTTLHQISNELMLDSKVIFKTAISPGNISRGKQL